MGTFLCRPSVDISSYCEFLIAKAVANPEMGFHSLSLTHGSDVLSTPSVMSLVLDG